MFALRDATNRGTIHQQDHDTPDRKARTYADRRSFAKSLMHAMSVLQTRVHAGRISSRMHSRSDEGRRPETM